MDLAMVPSRTRSPPNYYHACTGIIEAIIKSQRYAKSAKELEWRCPRWRAAEDRNEGNFPTAHMGV